MHAGVDSGVDTSVDRAVPARRVPYPPILDGRHCRAHPWLPPVVAVDMQEPRRRCSRANEMPPQRFVDPPLQLRHKSFDVQPLLLARLLLVNQPRTWIFGMRACRGSDDPSPPDDFSHSALHTRPAAAHSKPAQP
ncbi:hypothetical protein DFH06DRAFT_1319342 [Mycena polygramma]|nr:hypothetical protein DFH06DRAFT_1319342 [Mycena polygramma]